MFFIFNEYDYDVRFLNIIIIDGKSKWFNAARVHETFETRRAELCVKFATKSAKHVKHKNWFKLNTRTTVTRQPQPKYCPVSASTTRFDKSPISYLTKILNEQFKK